MNLSAEGSKLIRDFEGLRLEAYQDVAGIWTIGYGTIRYPDGSRVKEGDRCTEQQATDYFHHDIESKVLATDLYTTDAVTPNQFDALVSFVYNLGEKAFFDSTLRKRVNADPNDPDIRNQFMRWHFAGGKPVKGLWVRRHSEADHYFATKTRLPPMPRKAP